mgnify:CR=1 FL=1
MISEAILHSFDLALDLVAIPQDGGAEEGSSYLGIALRAIFVENILLAFFLGMCSYLAICKRVDSSIGLGVAVIFVLGLTVPLNWVIQTYILAPGALSWAGMPESDLSYLQFLTFIASIAAAVQIVEMAVDKFSPKLYAALGIFLPLIAVNCAILGSSWRWVSRRRSLTRTIRSSSSSISSLVLTPLATIWFMLS